MGASSSTTSRRSISGIWLPLCPRQQLTSTRRPHAPIAPGRLQVQDACMSHISPLVDPTWIQAHPDARIVDLRWSLKGPPARQKYDDGHIPGAVYADLDHDLSRPGGPGRHPFPSEEHFAQVLSRWAVDPGTHVVVYDDAGGSIAARLRKLKLDRSRLADVDVVQARRAVVLDARAPERYRGEVEPLDKKKGHIPGALNAPLQANLTPAQRFRPPEELRKLYEGYGSNVIVSCGSGVTACHDALAMEIAGLPSPRLYVGSFSGWIEGPAPPLATGPL